MMTWTVHVAIIMLFNLNFYIEGGIQRKSTACLKELNAFSVLKTTSNVSSDSARICSTVFDCCNKRMEREMKTQVEKDIKQLVSNRNQKAKKEFNIAYDVFKVFSENVLQQTSDSAIKYLQVEPSTAKIASQVAPLIRDLFIDLQKYLTERDFKIVNSTNTFFMKFFPVLYKTTVILSKNELPVDFTNCLKDKMHLIKPFRNVPQEITAMLEKDLSMVQVFLSGLGTAGQVLHVTKNVELSENCTSSMVKMTYCSLCNRLKDSKPCLGYCSRVMSQCLKPYSDIQRYWDIFIKALDQLSFLLSKSLDATKLFQKLQLKISDAMSHIVLSSKTVQMYCGNASKSNGNRITSLKKKLKDPPAHDISDTDLYLTGDSINVYGNLPTASHIENQLSLLRNNLSESRIFFGNLSFELCANDGLASLDNGSCWNGTSQARYDQSSDIVLTNMRPNNSEFVMKGALQLLQMAHNEINEIMSRKSDNDDSSGDSGSGESGSGEPTDNGSGGDCDRDIEECDGSGGSGEKSSESDKSTKTGGSSVAVTTSPTTPLPNGACGRCEYKRFLMLFCFVLWRVI